MKLSKVAGFMDKVVATDAYGVSTFLCQIDPTVLFKVDGVVIRKKSLTCKPSTVIPPRGVITIDGEHYLVGTGTSDYWKGAPIRTTYVIQGADGLADLHSIAGKLTGTAPTQAYAAVVFNRYLPDAADSSKYPPQYQVFLAGNESAPADSLISVSGVWYLVKESYGSNSGLRIALANVLDTPIFETVNYGVQTYNPVTDTTSGVTTSVNIMRVKWQDHFKYLTAASTTYERGDIQVFVLKSAMPAVKPSDTLTLSDGTWKVVSRLDEGLLWSLHVRRG